MSLNAVSQKFEKELAAAKEDVQRWQDEIRKIKDDLNQQLKLVEVKADQVLIGMQVTSTELTKKIEIIKHEYAVTKETTMQKLINAEKSITTFKEYVDINQEGNEMIKQELLTLQNAISKNGMQKCYDEIMEAKNMMTKDLSNYQEVQFQILEKVRIQNDINIQFEGLIAELQERILKTVSHSVNINTTLAYLIQYSPYSEYQKKLITKANHWKSTDNHSFPLIVEISNITELIKNVKFLEIDPVKELGLIIEIINHTYVVVRIKLHASWSITEDNFFRWCQRLKVLVMNQIDDSNHYLLDSYFMQTSCNLNGHKMYNKKVLFSKFAFENLLKVTRNTHYVLYNSIFLSIDHPDFHRDDKDNKEDKLSLVENEEEFKEEDNDWEKDEVQK